MVARASIHEPAISLAALRAVGIITVPIMSDFPKARIEELIKEMQSYAGSGVGDKHQRPVMATIHGIIAEEQAKSAEKLERQTETLINLTRGLFRLTWILVVLTAGLLAFTYMLLRHG